MSDSGLPVTVEYRSNVTSRKLEYKLSGGRPDAPWWHYFNATSAWTVFLLLVLAIFVAAKAKQLFIACIYLVSVIRWCRWIHYTGKLNHGKVDAWLKHDVENTIKLEITDAGFTEHDRDVQSFVPWSAMRWFVLREGALCVSLANNLSASIPSDALQPASMMLETLEKILLEHGVPKCA